MLSAEPEQRTDMNKLKLVLAALALAIGGSALAHGEKAHAPKEKKAISTDEKPFGREGDPRKVTRNIKVDMNDKMRFSPQALEIRRGEVVRFQVKNSGKVMHEMVLGTMQELKEHAELMRKHPGMEHDEPYMAHVAPGKAERIVWHFTKAGEFYYGCLMPGHFEAGMIGRIVVR
jgi:uncharacterized cupredoxin-like copper-binding protein